MNAPLHELSGLNLALDAALENACARIAPQWPLHRAIAVNPCWGRIDQPFGTVHGRLQQLFGARLVRPANAYREAWLAGEILPADLMAALAGTGFSEAEAVAALDHAPARIATQPLLSDVLDQHPDATRGLGWRERITQQVSQCCAAWFDVQQADWHQAGHGDLYSYWRAGLADDLPAFVAGDEGWVMSRVPALPGDAKAALRHALMQLEVPVSEWEEAIEMALLRMLGWASCCAWRRWDARLAGKDDDSLVHLAAIRLAWEALVDDGARGEGSAWARWRAQWSHAAAASFDGAELETCWQRAHEYATQRQWCAALGKVRREPVASPAVQAVFCIDVRSEVFRRALESVMPTVQTRGFAGFFGLPLAHLADDGETEVRLPGLLAPALTARAAAQANAGSKAWKQQARPFARLAAAGFSMVEALGLGALGGLLRDSLPGLKAARGAEFDAHSAVPDLQLPDPAVRADLAAKVLGAMGMVDGFAPLVLLVGHGAQCANNPHAAALQCGACGGHAGDVNAKVLAALLNDAEVRAGLVAHGIEIPAGTRFIAGLHNTTTDEVVLYQPAGSAPLPASLLDALAKAGNMTRAERAPSLGLAALAEQPAALLKSLQARARDWSETRPEWGLADNAAFIAAPRSFTRGMDLEGRSFLHDYDHALDADRSVLELILTAPLVVAHWINLQYHASTVDPLHFGAGNKVLHNVVGGNLGVFEGNAGDLRVGLPWQSVHDGERFMHTPLRLTAFIAAPADAIDAVLAKHEAVRQLVDNEWLYLFRLDDDGRIEKRRGGRWLAVEAS